MRALLVLVASAVLLATAPPVCAYDSPEPIILSAYRSMTSANQRGRTRAHAGVDLGGKLGSPVLAAADGVVARLIDYWEGCGTGVILAHPGFKRWTAYCHLQQALVRPGQTVSRGQTIGLIGISGNAVNVPHVHWELCTSDCSSHRDGDLSGTADPLSLVVGCFDPGAAYPTDRLVLTFPVECLYWAKERHR
ncbi:MAG TPA: M23 family metallopeptidase [Methylomirabilota bacterium]|nr:M23 family metallopeptidase [Methylomirabilota bacterium]